MPFGAAPGLVWSAGGIVVVVPGGGVCSFAGGGADVEVSAGGELADPAGDVDSCFEQADMKASAPTHNNRTLRFIKSPHCKIPVTPSPASARGATLGTVASGVPARVNVASARRKQASYLA